MLHVMPVEKKPGIGKALDQFTLLVVTARVGFYTQVEYWHRGLLRELWPAWQLPDTFPAITGSWTGLAAQRRAECLLQQAPGQRV